MKLNIYSQETMPTRGREKRPDKYSASFNHRGMVSFGQKTVALMGLKKGDKICLAQDDQQTHCWYFFKDDSGFELRSHTKGGLWFSHARMVKEFLESLDLPTDIPFRTPISAEPKKVGKKLYFLLAIPFEE